MAENFAAPRHKYWGLTGLKYHTAHDISSGLMTYKKAFLIQIHLPCKNLGLTYFPWLKSENLT